MFKKLPVATIPANFIYFDGGSAKASSTWIAHAIPPTGIYI